MGADTQLQAHQVIMVADWGTIKLGEKRFWQSTRNAKQTRLTMGQFADDAALLATTHIGTVTDFASTASDYGQNCKLRRDKRKGY